jgi:hypothetical protein
LSCAGIASTAIERAHAVLAHVGEVKQAAVHIAYMMPSNKRSAKAILRAAEKVVDAGNHGPWGDGSDYDDHRDAGHPLKRRARRK